MKYDVKCKVRRCIADTHVYHSVAVAIKFCPQRKEVGCGAHFQTSQVFKAQKQILTCPPARHKPLLTIE